MHSANRRLGVVSNDPSQRLVVQKFGGTSVREIEKLRDFVKSTIGKRVIVVSALAGITDKLHNLVLAIQNSEDFNLIIQEIHELHEEFFVKNKLEFNLKPFLQDLFELSRRLSAEPSSQTLIDQIKGWGELVSSSFVAKALSTESQSVPAVNAYDLVHLKENSTGNLVLDPLKTREFIRKGMVDILSKSEIVVVPGYIATGPNGKTTLGRGGTDYSASIFACALNADELQICKEVPGFMSADPRLVNTAITLSTASYRVASEGAAHGVKALHHSTITGPEAAGIPVLVLNTLDPNEAGTVITNTKNPGVNLLIARRGITVFQLRNESMPSQSGWLKKASDIFAQYRLSIETVSTSETGISLSIPAAIDQTTLVKVIEQLRKDDFTVDFRTDLIAISLIGDALNNSVKVHLRAYEVMDQLGIAPAMVSQDTSGANLTYLFEVDSSRLQVIARTFHDVLILK